MSREARPPIRVLVVDDQPEVRDSLTSILGALPGIVTVGDVGDGQAAIDRVVAGSIDVVLMDLRMPRVDGVVATEVIHRTAPEVRVVVLTTFRDDDSITRALAAGARGYLTKDITATELAYAIGLVHQGGFVLGPDVALPSPTTASRAPGVAPPTPLTRREHEVLERIAAGRTNDEIARDLHVGAATVKTHVNNLFAKLGVQTRAQAVVWAFESGTVSRP